MKRFYLIAAAAAAVLAAGCAKNEVIQNQGPGDAISFGVYTPKTVTKAVSATDFGNIDDNVLGDVAKHGFGVFAYYTDNADYTTGSYYANFMYNQQVKGNGNGSAAATTWTYSPIKYWPNEHGASASSGSNVDKLTFMAYAPWVDVKTLGTTSGSTIKDGSSADATEGIYAMTGNYEKADALLCFKVPDSSAEQIDLLYGRLKTQSVNVDGTSEPAVAPASPDYAPIENLTKEKTGGKISIIFKHALAKFAINIKEVVDKASSPTSVNPSQGVDPNWTKVVVKSLNILSTELGTKGNLNLYTGNWNVTSTTSSFPVSPLPESIRTEVTPTTYPSIAGVVEGGLANTIDVMLIPGASSKVTGVEIVYYVCTKDDNLYGGVSVVENHITKYFDTNLETPAVNDPIDIVKGTQYNITIQLGLTSVKLSAEVSPWDDGSEFIIDLPKNVS